jgi:oligoribonuclease NrnB/cAMP/cGMP phosphodiesterase (DHH superfamily)
MDEPYNYVIYHRGCIDGYCGFIILNKSGKIDPSAYILPDVPSAKDAPPKIDGMNVIIIDCAYKYKVLDEIVNRAQTVTFIDHHQTIKDDVVLIQKKFNQTKLKIIYDESESGASLVWKYFFPNTQIPLFVRYIKDNDIGLWKLKHTYHFIAGLDVDYPTDIRHNNIRKWMKLFNNKKLIKKIIKKGSVYWEYIQHQLDANVKKYSMESFPSEKIYEAFSDYFDKPGQYKVAVYNTNCPNPSLLGKRAMTDINCDFAMIYNFNMDKKEYIASLRSSNIDVGKIAKIFGGGGHRLAAAMSLPISKYNITDLFFTNSLPRENKK